MILVDTDYQVICSHSLTKAESESIIMISITEDEEVALDKGLLKTVKNGIEFDILSNRVICYGEIDFHNGSDDYYVIEGMSWLNHLIERGICVPANYNYDEHCCYSPINKAKWYDTTNPAIVAQYTHGKLGKPKRCCIFREKKNDNKGTK